MGQAGLRSWAAVVKVSKGERVEEADVTCAEVLGLCMEGTLGDRMSAGIVARA
jgi:hypothetical protein